MVDFVKGDAVEVRPVAYPMQVYPGVVVRKAGRGYRVVVNVNGWKFAESYSAAEVQPAKGEA